ncbi:MAG: GNAT family N-acetyltransferase [Bacteroidota bacterium]|nr:GNAT family N-acetyltransferase [Bacteroidota bacterium]MDP3145566.1 GNAT family N-acetyltransferase [Bacteroidota bacterium]MDP3557779.1 GNAT family N-acetyltransferase [Bacteroidota bacterium]
MNNKVLIREYKDQDKAVVLNLLKLNTPKHFALDEEKDFIYYLEHELNKYFVLELEGSVVGCGGINFMDDKTSAKISWDIFHPDYQAMGLGTLLLNYRIEKLEELKNIKLITVRTSQQAYKFYEKLGFEIIKIVEDYWAKDFHLYEMKFTK